MPTDTPIEVTMPLSPSQKKSLAELLSSIQQQATANVQQSKANADTANATYRALEFIERDVLCNKVSVPCTQHTPPAVEPVHAPAVATDAPLLARPLPLPTRTVLSPVPLTQNVYLLHGASTEDIKKVYRHSPWFRVAEKKVRDILILHLALSGTGLHVITLQALQKLVASASEQLVVEGGKKVSTSGLRGVLQALSDEGIVAQLQVKGVRQGRRLIAGPRYESIKVELGTAWAAESYWTSAEHAAERAKFVHDLQSKDLSWLT